VRARAVDERGQVMVLIIGFAVVVVMLIAVVVDASAAYIQRQGLTALADGAALRGADLGATGEEVYRAGVTDERLDLARAQAAAAVRRYLAASGAYRRYPGLTAHVSVDPSADRITVRLAAPLDLPLTFPGSPQSANVGATGSAVVDPDG
jgi:uncharacterized membrane protein